MKQTQTNPRNSTRIWHISIPIFFKTSPWTNNLILPLCNKMHLKWSHKEHYFLFLKFQTWNDFTRGVKSDFQKVVLCFCNLNKVEATRKHRNISSRRVELIWINTRNYFMAFISINYISFVFCCLAAKNFVNLDIACPNFSQISTLASIQDGNCFRVLVLS